MSDRVLSIDIQPRDLAILRELFESRVMTLGHVTALHFEGKGEPAKKRIQKLKAARLIAERPRRVYEPSVLLLAPPGIRLLKDRGILADYPRLSLTAFEKRARVSDLTLRHELAVMDVKVAFSKAVSSRPNMLLSRFCTWPLLYQFEASIAVAGFAERPAPVKPDGFIHLVENGEVNHYFFVELDRTTKNVTTGAARAVGYLDYYRTGGFAAWRGKDREQYRKYPFRVLGVFLSEQRRHNFALRLLRNNPPIRHQFQLASFEDVVRDPLGAIWNRPVDYDPKNTRNYLIGRSRAVDPGIRYSLFPAAASQTIKEQSDRSAMRIVE